MSGPDPGGRPPDAVEERLRLRMGRLAERAEVTARSLDDVLLGRLSADPRPADGGAGRRPTPRRAGVRRIRLGVTLGVAAAAAAAVLVVALGSAPSRPHPSVVHVVSPPPESLAPVAWVSDGSLYVADGSPARVTAAAGGPENPEWSPDHRYIAYVTAAGQRVHVAGWDGTADHTVIDSAVTRGAFSWAPRTDQLAVVPAGGGIVVVPATGGPGVAVVASSVPVESLAWSWDGTRLAYTTPALPGRPGGVFVVPATGGAATPVRLAVPAAADVLLAGWWADGRGLLFWVDPAGDPGALADGLALESAALSGGPATTLAVTLVYHPWLAWSPDGSSLALVAGGGASPAAGKQLVVCRPEAGTCDPLPQPAGTVSIDPAWSPDGSRIAFVRAPDTGQPYRLDDTPGWFPGRQLWVEAPDGTGAHAVSGAPSGAVLPAWSRDGSQLGYSTADAVQTIPAAGGTPTVLADGLSGSNDGTSGPDANGKQPWTASAVWETRGGSYPP